MKTDTPRGIRNSNPLNIRYRITNDWMGKITDSCKKDMQFEEFRHPKYGFRAAFILIHRYIKRGQNRVKDIIEMWAPPTDGNDTKGYIQMVCIRANLQPESVIECCNYRQMSNLVEAMFAVENGVSMCALADRRDWYSAMSEGYNLYIERFVH